MVSLIIPALNEAPAIGRVLASLPADLFSQVLVVDNGSVDGTSDVAAAQGATVIVEPRRGYGRACLAGISRLAPDCRIVVFMDGDASDEPSDASQLVEPILRGKADLVIGVRTGARVEPGAMPWHQRVGNRIATGLVRCLFGGPCTDLGPFRAIERQSLLGLEMQDPTFGWTVEMQAKALKRGLRLLEVPVGYRPRIGVSKVSGSLRGSLLAGAKILWTIARVRV